MKANRLSWCLGCLLGSAVFQLPGQQGDAALSGSGRETNSNPQPIVIFEALCKALRDNYPMLEYAGWREDKWPADFRRRIAKAASHEQAYQLMDELVCHLNDYHTRFVWPEKPRLVSLPFRVEPVPATGTAPADHSIWGQPRPPAEALAPDGIAIAVVNASTNCEVRIGDEILSVNGVPVQEALAQAWGHAVGCSIAGKLRSAAGRMLAGATGADLRLKVRRVESTGTEQLREVALPRSAPADEPVISSQEAGGVPVIRITRFANPQGESLVEQFDTLLSQYRSRPGLIIDVRRNGGGQDRLATEIVGCFIEAPVIASISFHRQVPGLTFERTVIWTEPRLWRYEGRVAVLTDEGCMSATEHFVSGMAEAGALLCGTPTSGACGLIRRVELPGGATLYVSQTFPLHTGGIPSPLLGIAPHRWAIRTLADLRMGQDTALRAAMEWVNSLEPLPVRFQPMASFSRKR